jgi:hypothetical protein
MPIRLSRKKEWPSSGRIQANRNSNCVGDCSTLDYVFYVVVVATVDESSNTINWTTTRPVQRAGVFLAAAVVVHIAKK